MSTENALLTILVEKINNDSLILPTLPEVAVKVRRASDDPDINLARIGEVINQDPALSARIMKIANSAYLGRSVKVENLNQAVTRIGLRQIKNIATALAMEQLFVSRNDIVKTYMSKSWNKTVEVASTAIVVMRHYMENNKHSGLNMDTITLAALVHNIGVLPILAEAERHPDVFANPTFLASAIRKLAGRLGGAIMRAWEFSDDFIEVAERWKDSKFQTDNVSYVDVVRVAGVWCGELGTADNRDALLKLYVDKGVIPDAEFLASDEVVDAIEEVKSAFKD